MTGPKHLWSGDWEDESATPEPPAARDASGDATAPEPDLPQRSPRRIRRAAWIATGAVVVVAAAAIVLPNLRSSSTPSRTTPTTPAFPARPSTPTTPRTLTTPSLPTTPTSPGPGLTAPTPSAAVPGPTGTTPAPAANPITWLGMEIVTLAPDAAVVETVALNSEGDRAGVEPGDVIETVNGRPIAGADGIVAAVKDLHSGDAVQLQIGRHSAMFDARVTMGAQPAHP